MKDIRNYEGLYAVTEDGKVYSYKSKRFLTPFPDKDGYNRVNLRKDGGAKQFAVHRLVAETFVENPDNLETVDHIDGNKQNNTIGNLQWMTRGGNAMKANSRPVKCLENGIIYPSQTAAAKELNLDASSISKAARGLIKQTKGYHFEYVEKN